ncbi:hypothetical protein, partial [Streptomyces xantholiticus]
RSGAARGEGVGGTGYDKASLTEQLPITIGAIIFIVIGELIIKRKLQVQVSQPSSSHMNSYS